MLQALEISRIHASHFENMSSYWSWNVNSYCDNDVHCYRDYDSAKSGSFSNASSLSSHGNNDVPTLTTASSCISVEDKQFMFAAATNKITTTCCMKMMRRFEMEPEDEEH